MSTPKKGNAVNKALKSPTDALIEIEKQVPIGICRQNRRAET
jgi:hypothetical protein